MFIDSSRLILLFTGGWVAIKSLINSRGAPGFAMQTDAMDFIRSIDSMRESVVIFFSADANAIGLRVMCAPVASAAYSRLRDTAMRNSGVIIKLNTENASHTIINIAALLPRSLSSDE